MSELIHVYCDESCHLENDQMRAMVLGAVWCPASHRAMLARKIKALKKQYGLPPQFEIKWVKVSPGQLGFYQALLDLFFDEPLLRFRGLVVPDKQALDHGRFAQNHDEFYYKMWYLVLNRLIDPAQHQLNFLDHTAVKVIVGIAQHVVQLDYLGLTLRILDIQKNPVVLGRVKDRKSVV